MKMTNTDNGKKYIVVDWQKIQKEIEKFWVRNQLSLNDLQNI